MAEHKAWHHRGYLPHLDAGATVQFVTFRLADSLPRDVFEACVAAARDRIELHQQLEAMIDAGRGACLLRDAGAATIVRAALEHFDGERYRLIAWAIMPNHVHALVEQVEGWRLGDLVRSWKTYTAKSINERRGGAGTVWAKDYFDRFIRDEVHFLNTVRYIEENPVKAGLAVRPSDWPFSSAAER